ncbi:NAD(P)-binding domain-containing protein [Cupriavidus consociatus]|uniref:NAD(P)-binding domain-containing protein n=1 Tax=Cupriavidus consociatus TaxID=2821357 RepID=UPI001AE3FDB8|nr:MULTISPECIES: NAD(P)-binding domain-containing protein [unclassified Cupriavidus]MBP0623537.1 NAD(P)-binding domain-containing protein [Cupriavidus sp. LEh25]MDK2660238.1 NAD(P)-binding domain-containing protein [Cupriavidus sp. LEh21]
MISTTDTVIIGAGPYGLSISAHLSHLGVPHQVLGEPMLAWRHFMPPGMLMRSEAFASDLYAPLAGYRLEDYSRRMHLPYAPIGMRLPLERFVEYGLWFQSQLVSHVRPVEVTELRRQHIGFRASLSDGGTLLARRAVVALGLKGFEHMPPFLQGLPKPHVMHSGEIGNLMWARGKRIVIIGGGQSALGLAALFNELGAHVRVLVRDSIITWNKDPEVDRSLISRALRPEGGLAQGWYPYVLSEFPQLFRPLGQPLRKRIAETSFGPSGAWWLRDRVAGKVDVQMQTTVRHGAVRNGEVVLDVSSDSGPSTVTGDHVVVATGFRVDLARHSFLSPDIVAGLLLVDGWPEVSRNFESRVPGLYVTGPAAAMSFGPVLRFVYGAKFAAPRIARHVSLRHAEEGGSRPFEPLGVPQAHAEGGPGALQRPPAAFQEAKMPAE